MDEPSTQKGEIEPLDLAKRTIKNRKAKARKAKRDMSNNIHNAYSIPNPNSSRGAEGRNTPNAPIQASVLDQPATSRESILEKTTREDFENAMAQLHISGIPEAHNVEPKEESENVDVKADLLSIQGQQHSSPTTSPPSKRNEVLLADGEMKGKIYILGNDRNEPPIQKHVEIAKNEMESRARRQEDNAKFLVKLNAAAKKREREEELKASGWVVVEPGQSAEHKGRNEDMDEVELGGSWVDWIRRFFRQE